MSSLEAVDHRLTFDDILEAVQDSKRGRWFLKEFEQRLNKQDTSSILQAIYKLEARMDGFGVQAGQPDELVKVKTAIANARNDLLKLGVGKEALSKEGHMFAELAELTRKAMPTSNEGSAGVVRTLQLVAEIEKTITPVALPTDQSSKFFSADENLFERPSAPAKPALVLSTTADIAQPVDKAVVVHKDEVVATGAKLIIRKTSSQETTNTEPETPAPAPVEAAAPAVAETAPTLQIPKAQEDVTAIDTPRIVIIRRKAEDMPEVETESAA